MKRTKDINIEKMINNIFYNAVTTLVSCLEAFLATIITSLLKYNVKRIEYTIRGRESDNSIPVDYLIDYTNDKSIDKIINGRVEQLFYSSPSDYLLYLKEALDIELKKEAQSEWIKLKVKRDLIVIIKV